MKVFVLQDLEVWYVAIVMMIILLPITLIRDVKNLSFTFIIGNMCILGTVLVVSTLAVDYFHTRKWELGKNVKMFNERYYSLAIGFACYAFEGIGCVMPIMQASAC